MNLFLLQHKPYQLGFSLTDQLIAITPTRLAVEWSTTMVRKKRAWAIMAHADSMNAAGRVILMTTLSQQTAESSHASQSDR
jgi:hypothetical protein